MPSEAQSQAALMTETAELQAQLYAQLEGTVGGMLEPKAYKQGVHITASPGTLR